MVSPKKSHEQSKIVNSLDAQSTKKYYGFLLAGGTIEEFVAGVKKGTIKIARKKRQQGTVTPKFSIEETD